MAGWSPDGNYNITLPSDDQPNRSDALYTIDAAGGGLTGWACGPLH